METQHTPAKAKTILWILLALFTALWFSNLQYRHLVKPDEGRYAEVPREMVVSGDWVTPRLNGLKYFEKPPLQYWATAVAYEAFGQHPWTSRLWDALTGFAGILLTWFAGARLFGREAGRYAALILGGSFLYAGMGHVNTLDIGVTFFITLGIVGLLFGQDENLAAPARRNWMLLAWAALGLAMLSKGLIGIVLPGAALFLYSMIQGDLAVWKRMHWIKGLLVFAIVTVPWFYLVMHANPRFGYFFFYYEHIERYLNPSHDRYQPWYFFIPILLLGILPWSIALLDTLWRTWKDSAAPVAAKPAAGQGGYAPMPFNLQHYLPTWSVSVYLLFCAHLRAHFAPKPFNPHRYLLIWTVFVYVFFSKSDSKLPSYLLPIFPSLALLMGWQIARMQPRRLFWLLLPVLPILIALLVTSFFSTRFADNPVQVKMYADYAVWLKVALAIWLFGLGAALLWLWRSAAKMRALTVLAFASLIAVLIGTSGYNSLAPERSAYFIAEAIRDQIKPEVPFYSVKMYEQTLPFYLKRTLTLVDYTDELKFGTEREPERWISTFEEFAKAWDKDTRAAAIFPVYEEPRVKNLHLSMKEIYRDSQYIVVIKP